MNKLEQRCDCLILSPHLDDAVLSCALRILNEHQKGRTVMVATLFSKAWTILPGYNLYQARRHEDQAALAVLGATTPLHLNFLDAPFRNLFYSSFQRIIFGKHPDERALLEKITARTVLLYKELAPKLVLLPWAVGTHIDHRLTHQMWCAFPVEANIAFYEDRPYSFLPNSLSLRLNEVGAKIGGTDTILPADGPMALDTFAEGLKKITMYKNLPIWKSEHIRYLLYAARKFKSPPAKASMNIEPEVISTVSVGDLAKIEAAMAAYKSQLPILYKDMDTFRQESASYAHTFAPTSLYAERYWKLVR